MRRFFALLILALLSAAPGMSLAQTPENQTPEKVIFLAHSNKNDRSDIPTAAMAMTFKEQVERRSNGALKVEIFPEGQLGPDPQVVQLVRKGVIQVAISSVGGISKLYPLIAVLDFPFAYGRMEETYAVLDGPFGQKLRRDIEAKTGIAIMGFGDTGGFFIITNSKRPVRSPADMAGLRMRTMASETQKLTFRSLGAEPVGIAWSQVYTSLQGGLADGQTNPVAITRYGRLDAVQKYMTMTNHFYVPFVWTANPDFLGGLSPEERQVVEDSVKDAIAASRAMGRATPMTEPALRALMPRMEIYFPKEAELEQFRRLTQPPMTEYIAKTFGDEGTKLLGEFQAAIKAARKH